MGCRVDPNWIKQTKYLVVPATTTTTKLDVVMYSRRRYRRNHRWIGSTSVDFRPDTSEMIDWEAKRLILTNKKEEQVAEMLVNVVFRPLASSSEEGELFNFFLASYQMGH